LISGWPAGGHGIRGLRFDSRRNVARSRGSPAYEIITGPLLEQPHRVGKQLLPPLADRFSARRGTYRVIYRIDDKAHIVTVVDIGHRRDVYRTW
jgi:mRNA interferase RelE/StbE